jgi:hypothetical protein
MAHYIAIAFHCRYGSAFLSCHPSWHQPDNTWRYQCQPATAVDLISFVLQKPRASAKINQWLLLKYPALHAQLVDVHARPTRIGSSMLAVFNQPRELTRENLTPRGQKIYMDLRDVCSH